MAQGRFRQGRYQQGIGIPETLGVQPTTWTPPVGPEPQRVTWTSPSIGIRNDYGSTPKYVDTVPHRWTYKAKNKKKEKEEDKGTSTTSTTPPTKTPFGTPPSGPPTTGPNVPPTPPAFPAPTGAGMPVPPPPSVRRATAQARATGQPLSTPPLASQGMPTPPPPTGRQVLRMPPMNLPPMSGQGADFLTASARSASDEPFTPNVEWRDEPENPFPVGTRREFDARRMFDPDYLPEKERSTTPANSRTQNRKPKNT